MNLNKDLLAHTIFLQRLVAKERQKIMSEIKALIAIAIDNASQFRTLKMRNSLVRERAKTATHDLQDLYDYERQFIKKLLKKYENNNSK